MPECIIKLGLINKKLLFPLFYIIIYWFVNIYEDHIAEDSEDYEMAIFYIEGFGMKISEVMIFFIANKFKYKSQKQNDIPIKKQKYFKDFSILFLLTVFYMANELSPYYLKPEDEKNDITSRELYLNDAIELIFISVTTYFVLKYKYYKHHILSIGIIAILCVITDVLLKTFSSTNPYTIITSITLILADSFLYTYFKYLIDYKYYYYLDILYIYGIFGFICYFISFAIIMIVDAARGSYDIFYQFYYLYLFKGVFHMILRFIIFGLILQGFAIDILEFLMLDKLSPNYIIICFELGRIPSNLMENKDFDRWLVLILSVLQILFLSFYLEILELNFCGLNSNTRRNIKNRESSQFIIMGTRDEDKYSIGGYNIPGNEKSNEAEMTMVNNKSEESFGK